MEWDLELLILAEVALVTLFYGFVSIYLDTFCKVINDLFHVKHFDCRQADNGDLSIFGLSDLKRFQAIV